MRTKSIGITKSVYHPIVVPQVIDECFQQVIDTGKVILDPFEQAFFLMVHLPYLQPFEHVNTRVSRLTANIPLIRGNLCPLSFVNVPQKVYINGLLAIYELNRIEILRDVFEWAYERSCALDLLHNWFWLLKLSFLASLLLNFSTISLDMLLKFINKSAQKILIFPSKASYARGLLYSVARQTLGEPDPFRLRYRNMIQEVVRNIVREKMNRVEAIGDIKAKAKEALPFEEQSRFIETIEIELRGLHQGNIARYRLLLSDYEEWQKIWKL